MNIEKRLSRISMLSRSDSIRNLKLTKYGIIAGVILVSMIVAMRPTSRLPFMVIGLLMAAVAAFFLLRNLSIGLLGIILACFFIPNFLGEGGLGNTISPPVLLLLLLIGLWFVDMVARQKRIALFGSRTTLPALILLVITLIAFFNGQISYYTFTHPAPITAQIGGMVVFLLSIGAFVVVGNSINDLKWLKRLTWLFLSISALYILVRLFPLMGNLILPRFQYGSYGSIFWIWIVAISSSQAIFNQQLDKRWRVALIGLFLATLYVGIYQSYSWKSGWIPPLIAFFVILWVGFPRFRVALLAMAIIALFLSSASKLGDLISSGEDYSILTRLPAWEIVLTLSKANPFLGLGFANYFWYTPLIPILGYRLYFNSHNNYIDIIAQTGLIGLACFLWLAFELGRVGWEMNKKLPDGFSRAYVIGVLGGLAGTLASGMLGDWILPFVYNIGLSGFRSSLLGWMFFGGLLAIERLYAGGSDSIVEKT